MFSTVKMFLIFGVRTIVGIMCAQISFFSSFSDESSHMVLMHVDYLGRVAKC